MSATAEQIARLRRMTNEPSGGSYSDNELREYIERYPCVDEQGEEPYTWDSTTQPPTQDANEDWVPTYDLCAAAADVWAEKAGAVSSKYDYSDQGSTFNRSQEYEHMMSQSRYYAARRKPRTITSHMYPEVRSQRQAWVGNRPEDDE